METQRTVSVVSGLEGWAAWRKPNERTWLSHSAGEDRWGRQKVGALHLSHLLDHVEIVTLKYARWENSVRGVKFLLSCTTRLYYLSLLPLSAGYTSLFMWLTRTPTEVRKAQANIENQYVTLEKKRLRNKSVMDWIFFFFYMFWKT